MYGNKDHLKTCLKNDGRSLSKGLPALKAVVYLNLLMHPFLYLSDTSTAESKDDSYELFIKYTLRTLSVFK